MTKAIIVDHLTCESILKDVSFTIQSGELVGIIGSNGQEVTTILNIISGLTKPTSGFVSVLDYDPYIKSDDFKKQIAFLTQSKSNLLENLFPINILEITRLIYGLPKRDFNRNLNELTKYLKDPDLLANLIYKPKVLLVDNINQTSESVYEYNLKSGSTVLFATQKFDDLINLVRRIIILDKGQVLFDGAIDEVVSKFATEKIIKVKLSTTIDEKIIKEIGEVKKYIYPDLKISAPRSVVSLTAAELIQNFPITNLTMEELSIEEIIENMKHD